MVILSITGMMALLIAAAEPVDGPEVGNTMEIVGHAMIYSGRDDPDYVRQHLYDDGP
jgi:hypothetical protein